MVLIFSGTLFCSAFLMFSIQPLLGKLLLPRLGGSPQVWNTCMVFFQAVLFAGYLHAHYSSAYLGLRRQVIAHIAIACLALLTLPIALANTGFLSDTENPVLWIMVTLAVSIGAPMFVISSTAPLLQKWFSHTAHPAAHDPYFLYAASNLGSLLALLAYPFLIEPSLGLQQQSSWLSTGFVILVTAVVLCAVIFRVQSRPTVEPIAEAPLDAQQTVPIQRKLLWTVLSFAPSSLLLGVTTYITTDIAAVPLFWVVPLSLYLLTFVIAFARRPPVSHAFAVRAQAMLVSLLAVIMLSPALARMWWLLFVHLAAFFVTALVCHGELVRSRPPAQHLTQFYLWLSLGGVLGGVFNALVAPAVFNQPVEYSLVLVLACFLRPTGEAAYKRSDFLWPVALLLGLMLAAWAIAAALEQATPSGHTPNLWLLSVILAVAIGVSTALLKFSENRARFGLGIAAVLLAATLIPAVGTGKHQNDARHSFRSFFGVYQVYYEQEDEATILTHGTTIHGAQFRNPGKALSPLTYYHRAGPFRDVFATLAPLDTRSVAVVGLGSGALTCYGSAGTRWTYYEIDPLVEKIARNPKYFTYLRDCPPRATVVIGDARLMLRRAADAHYALIVIDAFSSDAIPTHLLTKEAIAEYFAKLEPDGLLAIHISNRDLNLEPVVANLATNSGLAARINQKPAREEKQMEPLTLPASVVVLARNAASLRTLTTDASWRPLAMHRGDRVWTDDYVNILAALRGMGKSPTAAAPLRPVP